MRYSHQGFGTNVTNLNSSLMLPGTSQHIIDLNNTQSLHTGSMGHIANMTSGNAQTKQWLNSSFDASKSANNLNYATSAYMSQNQFNVSPQVTQGQATQKVSKIALKNTSGNSRQPYVLPMTNYSDDQ